MKSQVGLEGHLVVGRSPTISTDWAVTVSEAWSGAVAIQAPPGPHSSEARLACPTCSAHPTQATSLSPHCQRHPCAQKG